MGLAYDATPLSSPEPIELVAGIAHAYAAKVEVVVCGPAESEAATFINRSMVALDFLLKDVAHRFHFVVGNGTAEDIENYLAYQAPELSVVLARQQLPRHVSPAERHTVIMANASPVPLLVVKS